MMKTNITFGDFYTVQSGNCTFRYDPVFPLNEIQAASGQLHYENRDFTLQKQGVKNARGLTDKDAPTFSLAGSKAEVAVALAFDMPFRVNYDPNKPADCYFGEQEVDVKCSPKHANLFISKRHFDKDTIYFCVQQLANNVYRLNGWIPGKEVKEEYLCDPGNRGEGYLIPWKKLNPFRKFCEPIEDDGRFTEGMHEQTR